jgi:mannitol/fructose-specific phosphotransferase system IIA component (Ntr-type)
MFQLANNCQENGIKMPHTKITIHCPDTVILVVTNEKILKW